MVDTSNWPARKRLKHSLLRRAFDQNRGAEVMLLIQWRLAQVGHWGDQDADTIKKFDEKNEGQPRGLRALNLLEEKLRRNVVHRLVEEPTAAVAVPKQSAFDFIESTPKEQRIMVPQSRLLRNFISMVDADDYEPAETGGVEDYTRPVGVYDPSFDLLVQVEYQTEELAAVLSGTSPPKLMH